ncbi:GntR family transcriptional regulator [Niallia sp. Krafla_26]|uniref:GntR family transcriptional regulator n=1 Tax=Niallia sp. Krafla_26 TaxID=3064703 RepID=UPI003D163D3F
MDFNSNLPIYMQIMNSIKTKIVSGEFKRGDKLPSVRDFSKELKVNPSTIQRAYQELEREEFVYTQRGMGTFVTENIDTIQSVKKNMASSLMDQLFNEMKDLGFTSDEIKEMVSEWFTKEERK